jgi:hypothetical protein
MPDDELFKIYPWQRQLLDEMEARLNSKMGLADLLLERQERLKEPVYIGVDFSDTEARTIITMMELKTHASGHLPKMVIIDEIQPLIGEDLQKILDTYGYPDAVKAEFQPMETPMIKKGSQMVKRHHPVPSTPRSPRRR